MNHLSKRITATIIDYALISIVLTVLSRFLPDWFWVISFQITDVIPVSFPSIGVFLIFICLACKDLIFRNASIGKRIMGLIIVDENWNTPSIKHMMKRGVMISTVGYYILLTSHFQFKSVMNWEIDRIKARVIEKELLERMQHECNATGEAQKTAMDNLYRNYTLDLRNDR